MKQGVSNRSLAPYLNPSPIGVYLKISLVAEDSASTEEFSFPFWALNDSDPLTRIVRARFVTEMGSEVKRVFLLLQKDKYTLPKDSLWPLHNRQVEESWQKAFAVYSREDPEDFLIVLGNQLDDGGELVPLGSLFFCKAKQRFFDPPCPSCGRPLEQCYNDGLLGQVGLPAYSTSLNRYLFCPSCSASERQPHFYGYEPEGLQTALVRDWRGLVKDFAGLIEQGTSSEDFPCGQCMDHDTCYGTGALATSRIIPFSFYPFFMLIFEEMPLNALEFLPLLSGASLEDLKAWVHERGELRRVKPVQSAADELSGETFFFFEGERRHFLEILYLKLTFLSQLIELTLAGPESSPHPDLRPTLDSTWVKLGGQASLMPQLWNFKVKVIDIARNFPESASPPAISSLDAKHFLGQAWFYTLLVNKRQDVSSVYQSLKQLLEVTPRGEPLFPAGVREEMFRPENLFWNPEGKTVDESWRPFWEEALALGDCLLRTGLARESGWSRESLWQRLVALRDGIKERLFMDQTRTQELGQSDEGRVLYTILKEILEKWRKALRTDDTGLLETVVLPSKGPRDERGIPDTKDEAAVKETVVVSPEGISDETVVATGELEQGDLEETVVISPASKEEKGPISSHERDEEPLPETVILSRKEPSPGGQGFPPEEERAAPREKATSGPEPTEEEIGRTRRKKEEDFLTETVFISPQEREKLDKDKKK